MIVKTEGGLRRNYQFAESWFLCVRQANGYEEIRCLFQNGILKSSGF